MAILSIRGYFNEAFLYPEKQKVEQSEPETKGNSKRNSIPIYGGSLKGQQLCNMYFA